MLLYSTNLYDKVVVQHRHFSVVVYQFLFLFCFCFCFSVLADLLRISTGHPANNETSVVFFTATNKQGVNDLEKMALTLFGAICRHHFDLHLGIADNLITL